MRILACSNGAFAVHCQVGSCWGLVSLDTEAHADRQIR
jgi:hypothetical protein